MNRFGYGRDRLFLAAVAGYVLNQGMLKPRCSSPFLHGYFNPNSEAGKRVALRRGLWA